MSKTEPKPRPSNNAQATGEKETDMDKCEHNFVLAGNTDDYTRIFCAKCGKVENKQWEAKPSARHEQD